MVRHYFSQSGNRSVIANTNYPPQNSDEGGGIRVNETVYLISLNTDSAETDMFFGLNGTSAGNSIFENRAVPIAIDLTFSKLTLFVNANTLTTDTTFTLFVNNSSTLVSVTVPFGQTGVFVNNSNSVAVAAEALVAYGIGIVDVVNGIELQSASIVGRP